MGDTRAARCTGIYTGQAGRITSPTGVVRIVIETINAAVTLGDTCISVTTLGAVCKIRMIPATYTGVVDVDEPVICTDAALGEGGALGTGVAAGGTEPVLGEVGA